MIETRSDLSGRRVVITGATGGVGMALARRLAAAGAELALVARRRDALEELADALGALAVECDLRVEGFADSVVSRLPSSWTPPDVLVNNAGGFFLAPFAQTKPEAFRGLLAVNLTAPFELTRAWLPGMLERGSGQIVNIGSIAGRRGFTGNAAYSASKFGLRGLHEVLVEELRGTGVKACWIEPSATDTPLWDDLAPDTRPDLPSRSEMLKPEAVAEAVYFAVAQPAGTSIEEVVIRANPPSGGPTRS